MTNQKFNNQSGNTKADMILSGVAAFSLAALAFSKVLDYVSMPDRFMNYAAAGVLTGILIFLVIAPMFRK